VNIEGKLTICNQELIFVLGTNVFVLGRSLFQPSKYISDCLPAPEHVVEQPACVKSSSLPSEQSTAPSHLLAAEMQVTTPVTHP